MSTVAKKQVVVKGAKAGAPVKKATKKAPVKEVKEAEKGIERSKDLPWCEKKVILFKTLKALKAFDAGSAKTASEIIAKSGDELSGRDVRHYSYAARAANLIEVAKLEGVAGYSFFLTKAGAKVDPVAELKAAKAAKE